MKYLIYFFQHRFAHTINVDFFTDLVEVFNNLIANDQLDYRQCLYAIQVVLIMLSGQGEALNIDPLHFYSHLYKVLFNLTAGKFQQSNLICT